VVLFTVVAVAMPLTFCRSACWTRLSQPQAHSPKLLFLENYSIKVGEHYMECTTLDETRVRHPDDLLASRSADRIEASGRGRLGRGGQVQEQTVVLGERAERRERCQKY
jgi:hypothetical protein